MARVNRIWSGWGSGSLGLGVLVCSLLGAFESAADWDVYVSGGLGISGAIIETDGDITNPPPTVSLFETDGDSSPLLDAAVGLRIPMDEIVPREWLLDVRLPRFPLRFELEAAGLREFELETRAGGQNFYSSIKATTVMTNYWLDLPLTELWRPIQYLGGLGRQPRLRQVLEPLSFYVGAGIGFSYLEIEGSSNALSGSDEIFDFAWNVGTGFNYSLSERVDLSVGYRYVGLGEQDIPLDNTGAPTGFDITYTPQVHEMRAQIRVEVYDFLSPWR